MNAALERSPSRLRVWLAALVAAMMVVAAACAPDDDPVEEDEDPPEPEQAIYIEEEITFTGNWDEWAAAYDAVGIHMTHPDYELEDFSADAVFGWDDQYFYIGVLVRETMWGHIHDTPGDVWQGSSLEWGLEAGDNWTKSHYAVNNDGDLILQTWEGTVDLDDLWGAASYNVTRDDDANLTIYELAVPWELFEFEPAEGAIVKSSVGPTTQGEDEASKDADIALTPGLIGATTVGAWEDFELVWAADGNGEEENGEEENGDEENGEE